MIKFLEPEVLKDPESLGKILAEMQQEYKKRKVPMNDEQVRYSMAVMLADEKQIEGMYSDFQKTFPIGGFFNRCSIFPIKYDKKLLCWIAMLHHESGIGGLILLGYYLQWWAFNNGYKDTLTLDHITTHCFPFGVFSEELLHEFWDKQKLRSMPDNLIDHQKAALSFMPSEELEPIIPR